MDDTQGSVFPKLAETTQRTCYIYAVGRIGVRVILERDSASSMTLKLRRRTRRSSEKPPCGR